MIGKVCTSKKCEHHGQKQPYENFFKRPGTTKDGYHSECKDCMRIRTKEAGRKRTQDRENFFASFM